MIKNVIAFNGSGNINGITNAILTKMLDGAKSKGAKTELVNLLELDFKGCRGCLACKKGKGLNTGNCYQKDDLSPYLEKIKSVGAIILGTPIYMESMSAAAHAFKERLLYPYHVYGPQMTCIPKKIKTGIVYVMGMPKEAYDSEGLMKTAEMEARLFSNDIGPCKLFHCYGIISKEIQNLPPLSVKQNALRKKVFLEKYGQKAFEFGQKLVE